MYKLICLLMISVIFGDCNSQEQSENPYYSQRKEMVDLQLKRRGIKDKKVIDAMLKVERHKFVLPKYTNLAYTDQPLPIEEGQTISQPYIVAYMTSLIEPVKGDKVLEIGTGSGYQAAVLAEIVDSVFTVEIIDELAKEASDKFRMLGFKNIWVKAGDGYFGWKEHAPFNKIIVTAAASEIPPILIEQLAEGGRMIIPIGPEFSTQYLVLVTKKDGKVTRQNVMPVRFVPFTRDD